MNKEKPTQITFANYVQTCGEESIILNPKQLELLEKYIANKILEHNRELKELIQTEIEDAPMANYTEDDENAGYIKGLLKAQSLLALDEDKL